MLQFVESVDTAANKANELRLETRGFLTRLSESCSNWSQESIGSPSSKDKLEIENDVASEFDESCSSHEAVAPTLASEASKNLASRNKGDGQLHVGSRYTHSWPRTLHPAPTLPHSSGSLERRQPKSTSSIRSEESRKASHPTATDRHATSRTASAHHIYRTTYSDANAWLDRLCSSEYTANDTDVLKARQALDVATAEGLTVERNPIFTGADALRVARRCARELLGQKLHGVAAKEGEVRRGTAAASSAPPSSGARASSSDEKSAKQDEAIQTGSTEIRDASSTPHKEEKECQTDASSPVSAVAASVASDGIQGAEAELGSRVQTPVAGIDCRSSHSSSKSTRGSAAPPSTACKCGQSRKAAARPSTTMNPILMYPRFPPEPTRYRPKSEYSSEFGRVSAT